MSMRSVLMARKSNLRDLKAGRIISGATTSLMFHQNNNHAATACFSSATSTAALGGGSRLEGKVALITGAASGIGKASAREFIQQGAHVIIADSDKEMGSQTATELGARVNFVHCDVTEESQVAEAVDFAVARHGKLDIMYNNAGIVGPSIPPSIADLNLDDFDRVMRVNVRGTMAGIKHAVRVMKPTHAGSILCTASITGILGGLGPHPYSVSKFTLPGIVKSVASEISQDGIRINCISPFSIPTPLVVAQMQKFYGVGREWIENMIYELGELKGAKCEDIDIARAVVFLASDEAKYISGHNLVVDGAFTCFKRLNMPRPDQVV
ncbi:hypothetical protein MKX01_016650 [Papaver californicum]|nr:hypothetical protein MKX01_016650 [Papaver californicum]